jgi:hypothetical protein
MSEETRPPISAEWLDEMLEAALPGVLERCVKGKQSLVADFIRLMELDRRLWPPEPVERDVEWLDWVDDPSIYD